MATLSIRSKRSEQTEMQPMTGVCRIATLVVVAEHSFDDPGAVARPRRHAYLAFVKRRNARVFPL